MQRDGGVRFWLKVPFLYNLFQDAIGGNALRRSFIESHVRAKAGDKVIDIGCGPAEILRWLPDVDYLGFDVNPACIASAERTHTGKGTFVVGDAKALWHDSRFRDADVVIGLGILHHLGDDEAEHCIRFAHRALKQGSDSCVLTHARSRTRDFFPDTLCPRIEGRIFEKSKCTVSLRRVFSKTWDAWVDTKPLRIP